MDSDPFNRIPVPPLVTPRGPSVSGGLEAAQLVPRYAIEETGSGAPAAPDDSGGTVDVIAALIASGATFIEKTGCDSGTPYTYWAPEWTADPS